MNWICRVLVVPAWAATFALFTIGSLWWLGAVAIAAGCTLIVYGDE